MFVRNIESTWGNATQMNLLDKLVFPYAVPNWGHDSEISELHGDRVNLQSEEDENFYRSEEFLIKA
mgnify:FL=1